MEIALEDTRKGLGREQGKKGKRGELLQEKGNPCQYEKHVVPHIREKLNDNDDGRNCLLQS